VRGVGGVESINPVAIDTFKKDYEFACRNRDVTTDNENCTGTQGEDWPWTMARLSQLTTIAFSRSSSCPNPVGGTRSPGITPPNAAAKLQLVLTPCSRQACKATTALSSEARQSLLHTISGKSCQRSEHGRTCVASRVTSKHKIASLAQLACKETKTVSFRKSRLQIWGAGDAVWPTRIWRSKSTSLWFQMYPEAVQAGARGDQKGQRRIGGLLAGLLLGGLLRAESCFRYDALGKEEGGGRKRVREEHR